MQPQFSQPLLAAAGQEIWQLSSACHDAKAPLIQTVTTSNAATGTERLIAIDLRSVLIRSIWCSVCAEKYDSPQLGHDHIGIFSTIINAAPLSKLRVTCLSCTALLPQCSQWFSAEVTGDDNKFAAEADFDDRLG